MKTIVFLSVLLIASATQLYAQCTFGIKGGYTTAWENYGDAYLPLDAKTHIAGFNVSVLAYHNFSKHFAIGSEPGFIERGASCVPGFITFESDTKLYFYYAELPVLIQAHVSLLNEKISLYIKGGYGISLLTMGYREDILLFTEEPPVKSKIDLSAESRFSKIDNGIYSGLGAGYNFENNQIFFAFDYYYGLINADKFNASKNRSINLNVGYLINL